MIAFVPTMIALANDPKTILASLQALAAHIDQRIKDAAHIFGMKLFTPSDFSDGTEYAWQNANNALGRSTPSLPGMELTKAKSVVAGVIAAYAVRAAASSANSSMVPTGGSTSSTSSASPGTVATTTAAGGNRKMIYLGLALAAAGTVIGGTAIYYATRGKKRRRRR